MLYMLLIEARGSIFNSSGFNNFDAEFFCSVEPQSNMFWVLFDKFRSLASIFFQFCEYLNWDIYVPFVNFHPWEVGPI